MVKKKTSQDCNFQMLNPISPLVFCGDFNNDVKNSLALFLPAVQGILLPTSKNLKDHENE